MSFLFGGGKAAAPAAAPAPEPTEASSLVGKGPKDLEGRRCVDVICLLLFAAFWVVMIALTSVVYTYGDPNKIFNGVDYMGQTCGDPANLNTSTRTKVWYPRIGDDLLEQSSSLSTGFFWDIQLYGVCVEQCPLYHPQHKTVVQDYGYGVSPDAQAESWSVYMSTLDLFNRCLQETTQDAVSISLCTIPSCTEVGAPCYHLDAGPIQTPAGAWQLDGTVSAARCSREVAFSYGTEVRQPGANAYLNWLFLYVGTISDTWEALWLHMPLIIVFGVVLATLINFLWLVLLYLFAAAAVWTCILLIMLGSLLGTIFCLAKAGAAVHVATTLSNSTINELGSSVVNLTSIAGASSALIQTAPASSQWMYRGSPRFVTESCQLSAASWSGAGRILHAARPPPTVQQIALPPIPT